METTILNLLWYNRIRSLRLKKLKVGENVVGRFGDRFFPRKFIKSPKDAHVQNILLIKYDGVLSVPPILTSLSSKIESKIFLAQPSGQKLGFKNEFLLF